MGNSATLLAVYCAAIIAASLAGGTLPALWRMSHTTLQLLMSGVGGFMLGVAILHLLPHATATQGPLDWSAAWMLGGVVSMFFLIRVFHVHQHAVIEPDHEHCGHDHGEHERHLHHGHDHGDARNLSWIGLALGLSLHTLIDGLALGAAVASDSSDSTAIFLAVLLHKPLDALSISSTMLAGKWGRRERLIANLGFSLMCPIGAIAFYCGVLQTGAPQNLVVGTALAFSAGVFLCVALADILPELSFHSHDRFALSAALLVGIAAAYAIGLLESQHLHGGQGSRAANEIENVEIEPLTP